MINKVILIGRMGQDPETTIGKSGTPRTRFSVALGSKGPDGEEKTTWVWITTFGKAAESIGKYGEKGRQVYLEGKLDAYGEDNRLSVTVFSVRYLSPAKKFGGPSVDPRQPQSEEQGGKSYSPHYAGGGNEPVTPF